MTSIKKNDDDIIEKIVDDNNLIDEAINSNDKIDEAINSNDKIDLIERIINISIFYNIMEYANYQPLKTYKEAMVL